MIKISLIVLIGLAGTAVLRRRSAALRHWVLTLAIMCAAATPVLELVVPPWQLPAAAKWMRTAPLALYIPIVERDRLDDLDTIQSSTATAHSADLWAWLVRIWVAGIVFNLAI